MENDKILVLRDNAKHELMQIKTVEDGITYLNKLKSIEVWVQAEKKDAELQNIIAEQKLRTQRILGELIDEGQRKGIISDRGENRYTQQEELKTTTIPELGITHKQSSSFQQIASIPQDVFEDFIHEKKEAVNNAVAELTTSGAVRLAKSLNNNNHKTNSNDTDNFDEEVKQLISRINALPVFYRLKVKQGIRRGR